MSDKIAPFLRELGNHAELFRWIVCRKTGRIIGWHPVLKEHLSPIQVVAWAAVTDGGRLHKGRSLESLGISDEYEAGRVAGFSEITHALTECCNYKCDKQWRKAVLVEIGVDWRQ